MSEPTPDDVGLMPYHDGTTGAILGYFIWERTANVVRIYSAGATA